MAYISGIFDGFFKAGLVPLKTLRGATGNSFWENDGGGGGGGGDGGGGCGGERGGGLGTVNHNCSIFRARVGRLPLLTPPEGGGVEIGWGSTARELMVCGRSFQADSFYIYPDRGD